MKLGLIAAVLGGLATRTVLADGLNCKGSVKCKGAPYSGWGGDDHPQAVTLAGYIHSLDNSTWIPDGHLIACSRTICAFLQGTFGLWASEVKGMAREIVEHGCDRCGSCPVQGRLGELTFNYVLHRCGHVLDGLCSEFVDKQIRRKGGDEEEHSEGDEQST